MPEATVNNVRLHYRDAGRGAPLLLLHGLGSAGQIWDGVTPELARSRRVIAPDLRGHGASAKPRGGYSVRLPAGISGKIALDTARGRRVALSGRDGVRGLAQSFRVPSKSTDSLGALSSRPLQEVRDVSQALRGQPVVPGDGGGPA